jgi:hypothetical protein
MNIEVGSEMAARRSAIEYFPDLSSRWPRGGGRAPNNNELEQAFALLYKLSPNKRPRGTRKNPTGSAEALAVASYLGGRWDVVELGRAIQQATGGKLNTWQNIIWQPSPEGMRDLDLYTVDGMRNNFSITLTDHGKGVVAAYCRDEDIPNVLTGEGRDQDASPADNGHDQGAASAGPANDLQNRTSPQTEEMEAEGDPTVLDQGELLDQVELMQTSMEGRRLLREHLERERVPGLVRQFKEQLSSFSCSICTFDFEERYGPIGQRFIEAHHREPIASRDEATPTSVRGGFDPVCSNCHRMMHRRAPPYTADELKLIIAEAKKRRGDN